MKAKIFLSYAHDDATKMEAFLDYLRILEMTNKAEIWTDARLYAGTEWDPKIKEALEAADIIIILITINPLVSRYVRDVEMKRGYEKYLEGKSRVICVIFEECPWGEFPTGIMNGDKPYLLKNFQAVKPNGLPIYAAGQPSLAWAMNEAYKQIESSIADFMRGRS